MKLGDESVLRPVVMLVDDEEPYTDVMGQLLKGYGFEVGVGNSARQALELLHSTTPDLILLDIMMPELDGITFLRSIRKNPRLSTVPILVVTAYPDTLDAAMEAGANGHLSKPFRAQELRAAIAEFVQIDARD